MWRGKANNFGSGRSRVVASTTMRQASLGVHSSRTRFGQRKQYFCQAPRITVRMGRGPCRVVHPNHEPSPGAEGDASALCFRSKICFVSGHNLADARNVQTGARTNIVLLCDRMLDVCRRILFPGGEKTEPHLLSYHELTGLPQRVGVNMTMLLLLLQGSQWKGKLGTHTPLRTRDNPPSLCRHSLAPWRITATMRP